MWLPENKIFGSSVKLKGRSRFNCQWKWCLRFHIRSTDFMSSLTSQQLKHVQTYVTAISQHLHIQLVKTEQLNFKIYYFFKTCIEDTFLFTLINNSNKDIGNLNIIFMIIEIWSIYPSLPSLVSRVLLRKCCNVHHSLQLWLTYLKVTRTAINHHIVNLPIGVPVTGILRYR